MRDEEMEKFVIFGRIRDRWSRRRKTVVIEDRIRNGWMYA
jgi:hypothetical protein